MFGYLNGGEEGIADRIKNNKGIVIGISIPTVLAIIFLILFIVFLVLWIKQKKSCSTDEGFKSKKAGANNGAAPRKF